MKRKARKKGKKKQRKEWKLKKGKKGRWKIENGRRKRYKMRRGFFFFFFFFFLLFTFKTTEICFGSTKMGIFCQEKTISHQEKNQEKLFLCLSLKNIPLTPLPENHSRSKIVFQNSVLESSNQHRRAGLSKYHPRAYKSAPQGQSINITPRNQ